MGVLNITPDSFFDGGRSLEPAAAVRRAWAIVESGADILDVGGESSRPGASPVALDVELERGLPVIREVAGKSGVPVSIDTWKPEVARRALAEGAEIINDITGLQNPEMRSVAAQAGAAVVAMHMRGRPWNMQDLPPAADICTEIGEFFRSVLKEAAEPSKIILDPGIGFGKTGADNLAILNRLGRFLEFRRPLLVGASRKSFIGRIGPWAAEERLPGSLAAAVLAVAGGARIIRCHDVPETLQAVRVAESILRERIG